VRRLLAGGVIDSSVAVKPVLLDEPLVDAAVAVLAAAAAGSGDRWAVPDLFDVECASVIRKAVRRSRLGVEQADRALRLLLKLPERRVASAWLAETALTVAMERSISVYDACYVALAGLLRVPLVTADERLVRALHGSGHDVVYLADVEVGPD
jgi:predicted nucleic acid-binding protein